MLRALTDDSLDRSAYDHLVDEIKRSLNDRVVVSVQKKKRVCFQNRVAHCLAPLGQNGDSTACWLNQHPPCINELVAQDCNS